MADNQQSDQEKTEEPTSKKLEKAKEEGNVSKSQEVNSVFLLAIATIVLYMSGGYVYSEMVVMFEYFYNVLPVQITSSDNAVTYWQVIIIHMVKMLTPLMIMLVVSSLLINVVQTGVIFTTKVLEPKGERISPIKGIKRLFSSKGLVELAKGVSKIFIVVMIIYFTVRSELELFISMPIKPLGYIMIESGRWVILIITRILAALLILAIIDAVYQRYKYRKDLRMSKQEVKDEYKQMEGDPQVKSQRRRAAQKLSRTRRIDHAVLNADVVVTNPTHYAVALRYKPEEMDAPVIMAKGMRKRALKIRELAKKYDIPIIENPPVARALYASGEEEQHIPPELYQTVAEILAYVYKIKKQHAA